MLRRIPNPTKFTDKNYDWKFLYAAPHDKFYTKSKTKHYQVFGKVPQYIKKFAKDNFIKYSTSIIKQPPGNFIPNHRDRYWMFKQEHKVKKDIIRYCVFLEDWKPGHYMDIEGKPIIKWKRGQFCILKEGIWHRGSNSGIEYKYTAQITGLLKTKKN